MNIKLMPQYLKSCWSGGKFYAKKYSPEICIGGSIVSGIACVVTACIATTKLKDIFEDHKAEVEKVHEKAKVDPDFEEKKELTKTYLKTSGKIARIYALPVALGITSVSLNLSSHGIMKKRNTILATMAAASEGKLNEYRKRVIEKFGEEVDQELAGNYVETRKEKEVTDPETGEKKYINETTREWKGYSEWARFWGPGSSGWEEPMSVGPGGNAFYINAQEKTLNDILKYRRYICINHIYQQLGFPLVAEGWDWGIIWDPNGPEKQFDFGLRNKFNTNGARFLNGEEEGVWLDPGNVQYIRDKVLAKNADVLNFLKEQRGMK